jgi:branched-chain amino acid transport system ATP-binding protein
MSGGLVLDGVEAGYGETVVLEGISLALPAGGSLAVLGRNGVGKTTLLATIMGHCLLRAGHIRFAGKQVSGLRRTAGCGSASGWCRRSARSFRR